MMNVGRIAEMIDSSLCDPSGHIALYSGALRPPPDFGHLVSGISSLTFFFKPPMPLPAMKHVVKFPICSRVLCLVTQNNLALCGEGHVCVCRWVPVGVDAGTCVLYVHVGPWQQP